MMGMHSFKPVIVAPTYNNAATLLEILRRVETLGLPMIVVDDGSTDTTSILLDQFAGANRAVSVTLLEHDMNCGKAAAMLTGFKAARELGYTHAATIDTDGQLDPEQIPDLLARAQENPTALVLGTRDDGKADYPCRSRFGRRFSNLMVRLESGVRVGDSQCGLRVYPLGLVLNVRCGAQRFGYETEIITRAGWAGCPITEAPVNCVYLPPGQRVSHFRPGMDSFRAVLMHARLIARTLAPWPRVRWPGKPEPWIPSFRSIAQWISPREAWRQLKHDEAGRAMFATGLAVGAFIANLPTYGLQTVIGLYASRRLHLHPVPVLLGTQVSTPPIGVALVLVAIYAGHLILHGTPPALPEGPITFGGIASMAPTLLVSWVVGSILVGLVTAVITFIAAILFFRIALPKRGVPAEVEA
jgi:uncharacterized protein (DUF2062 family)